MRTSIYISLLYLSLFSLAGAQGVGVLPDPKLTPGDAFDVTASDLCRPGYRSPADRVPIALKRQVFDRYRIPGNEVGYHVDHLIPVGLGGSNSISNLWPQSLSAEWGWERKNKLERKLSKMICTGELDLKTAQREIAADWIAAYKKYVGRS